MRKLLLIPGLILGIYLAGRALVEPFVINASDSSTYHNDWGGPSLAGVLAVHCGPGLLAAGGAVWWFVRTVRRRRAAAIASSRDRAFRAMMM
jgi:hypothetical protein